jgi:PIN domain nuclease of toxin-antitoxin system
VRLLLDTHALLWFVSDDSSLSRAAKVAIEDPANDVLVSVATAWEIAIKAGIGKLSLDAPSPASFFDEQMALNSFEFLSIQPAHAFRAGDLPFHHRDPFDRLLVAQALVEGLTFVTRDDLAAYGAPILW